MEPNEGTSQVLPTAAYIASLHVPEFKCDRNDKEQLKMHLVCSMLCCPKQIEDDETVAAERVNLNMCEVSRNYLNLYTVGRIATQYDRVEADRIDKNLERVFQLPLFDKIVEMDGRAKFKPIPPECIKSLYHRILRGGQCMRRREGEAKAKKERECHTPEAVYNAKVACNFLLELIEKERDHQNLLLVDWQSVQRRYQEMFTSEESEDKKLMEIYKEKYGLKFIHPSLNGEVVKSWTGRSSITKALSMPLFHKIHWEIEEGTGMLRVGFDDNIVLYDDEEIMRSIEPMNATRLEKERSNAGAGRKTTTQERRANELEHVIPLRERHAPNAARPVLPDVVSSPFVSLPKPNPSRTQNQAANVIELNATRKNAQQRAHNMNEPQYIPTSGNVESSDSEYQSEESLSEVGEYTDDEEDANAPSITSATSAIQSESTQQRTVPTKSTSSAGLPPISQQPAVAVPKLEPPLIKPRPIPIPVKSFQARQTEPTHSDEPVRAFRNQWEVLDDVVDAATQVKHKSQQQNRPSTLDRSATLSDVSGTTFSQPTEAQSMLRHVSAFASCKNPISTSKELERVQASGASFSPSRSFGENRPFTADRQSNIVAPPPTSVFSRPISDCHVRASYARSQTGSQRSPSAQRNTDYAEAYPKNSHTSAQQPSDSRMHNEETAYVQHQSDLYRETNRRDISASAGPENVANLIGGNRFSGDNQPMQAPETSYKGDLSGSNYAQPPSRNDYKERVPSHPFGDQRCSDNIHVNTQYRQSHGSFQYSEDRKNDVYRSQNISRKTDNCASRPTPSIARDPLDSFRTRSRQSVRSDSILGGEPYQCQNNSNQSMRPLTADQEARLRIIRDFTFLHRNVKDLGFRCLDTILSILPPDDSVDWVELIRQRLPEVEAAPFQDKQILLWKEGSSSDRVENNNFNK